MLHKQLTHKIRASSAQVIVNSSVRLCQTPDNFNVNLNERGNLHTHSTVRHTAL